MSNAKDRAFKEAVAPKEVKLPPENNHASLNDVKRSLKQKERMRRCQFFLCDSCDQPIHNPNGGYIVHGNIYVADANSRGGLIGNNFPDVTPGEKIEVTDVQETVYCKRCFIKAIGLFELTTKVDVDELLKNDEDFKAILKNIEVLKNLGVQEKQRNVGTAAIDTDEFFGEPGFFGRSS